MSGNKQSAWKRSIFTKLPGTQPTEAADDVDDVVKSKPRQLKRSLSENAVGLLEKDVTVPKQKITLKKLSANWQECFAPSTIQDLAIHPKKIEELTNWLDQCDNKQTQKKICLLTGPSGCGKTAAVRVLAEAHQYTLQEWISPVDQEMMQGLGEREGGGYVMSQVEAFKSFLLRASRYNSVLQQRCRFNKRLLLVEDFPNALLNDVTTFEAILTDYAAYSKSPLIFICSDTKSRTLNISYNLFSEPLKQKFQIEHIAFNGIATTLLQKAMKRFCDLLHTQPALLEQYKVPPVHVVDSIVVAAQGDIRNALLNLHFAAIKGAPNVPTEILQELEDHNSTSKKVRRKKSTTQTLKSMGRGESITFLHSIGRVLNPKKTSTGELLHNPTIVAELFSTEPQRLLQFAHRNYLSHFTAIEHVVEATQGLSLAELLHASDFQQRPETTALTLDLGVRSVMVTNIEPASGWLPVHGPTRWQETEGALSLRREWQAYVAQHTQQISAARYAVDYAHWVRSIKSAGVKS